MTLDTTTSSNVSNVIILAIGTATLSPLSFDYANYSLTAKIPYERLENRNWELEDTDPIVNPEQVQILQKINTLKSFSTSIIDSSQSLDNETIEIINKNFWDWI